METDKSDKGEYFCLKLNFVVLKNNFWSSKTIQRKAKFLLNLLFRWICLHQSNLRGNNN